MKVASESDEKDPMPTLRHAVVSSIGKVNGDVVGQFFSAIFRRMVALESAKITFPIHIIGNGKDWIGELETNELNVIGERRPE